MLYVFLKSFLLGGINKPLEHFLKTIFFGKYVGSDEMGNKYYKVKKMSDGLFTQKILKPLRFHLIGFCGFIIQ